MNLAACGAMMHFQASMPYTPWHSGERLPVEFCMPKTYFMRSGYVTFMGCEPSLPVSRK